MAEKKSANLARIVSKQAGRAKEILLQNLGKADKTTDDILEEHLHNFGSQQVTANRLHKDISNYTRCVRAIQTANKTLMDTLNDVYESQWVGHDLLYVQCQNSEMLWADLGHKLTDQVLIPLNTYQGQFPEMRKKIEKRGRKLIDYDKERHNVQQLQANSNRNEAKVARGIEQMERAKGTYEVLNAELHDELPALYDSRVLFLVTNMQTIFAAEEVFHSETSKVYSELEAIIDKLAKEVQKGTLPKTVLPKPRALPSLTANTNNTINNPPKATNGSAPYPSSNKRHSQKDYETVNNNVESNNTYDLPAGATTNDLPAGVLYRVKSSYKYQAEDGDELSFDVGEIISVIEYEDTEEQVIEEGWLLGYKDDTKEKGMFPANFTRPI